MSATVFSIPATSRATASSVASSFSARARPNNSALSLRSASSPVSTWTTPSSFFFSLPSSCARFGSSQIFGSSSSLRDFDEPHRLHIEVKDTSAGRRRARADPRVRRRSGSAVRLPWRGNPSAQTKIIADPPSSPVAGSGPRRGIRPAALWTGDALTYHGGVPRCRRPGRTRDAVCADADDCHAYTPLHTPAGFTSSHTLPAALPADALAFAFRDARMLVGGTDDAPLVPSIAQLERLGIRGDRHYLGELDGTGCVAIHLPADAPEPEAGGTPACARCSSVSPSRCSRSPREPSRWSNGIARIATAGAAERRRATSPESAPRNARRAATRPTRASRRP